MGAHTPLQSVIIQEKGSGRVLGQGLEGPGVMEEEHSMKNEKWKKKERKTTVHSKLHQKESQNKFVFKFLYESAKVIPFVDACKTWRGGQTYERWAIHQTQFSDRSLLVYLYWDHGPGARSAKYNELRRIRRRRCAARAWRRLSPDSDVTADLSCIYRGGLISTLFPCSHTGRCEAGAWR